MQTQSLLDRIADQLKAAVAAPRNPQGCKRLAAVVTAVAGQVKDPAQKQEWLGTLAGAMAGKEQYDVQAKRKTQSLRDP